MNFLESRRLLISTLSPVHVGCGEDYDPTRYVIEDDTLYEFEPGAALAALNPQDREQLLKIVSGPSNDRMLQQVQAFLSSPASADRHHQPAGAGWTQNGRVLPEAGWQDRTNGRRRLAAPEPTGNRAHLL